MFWEDPLCCHWDGISFSQSKFLCSGSVFVLSRSVRCSRSPPCLCRGRLWMRSTAPSACWPPAPRDCRWSAARRCPRSPAPPPWTTSCSPSRSSSAPTTLPRPPSNWSPSRPARRNSDQTHGEGENGATDGRGIQGGGRAWGDGGRWSNWNRNKCAE